MNMAAPKSRPRFITFTGADEHTDIERMAELSRKYPIEWGILFSPKRQGTGRYPPQDFIRRVVEHDGLHLSAHLCGQHSRDVLVLGHVPLSLTGFRRAQINSAELGIDPVAILRWGARVGVLTILQCRGEFPPSTSVAWLFDQSGGRGVAPAAWPAQHPMATCGYAGGIGPGNVLDIIAMIDATDFWIDMESGVRDEQDRFSLDKCEQVCKLVYDAAAAPAATLSAGQDGT